MKTCLRSFFLLAMICAALFTNAQYCTPALTTGGVWLGFAGFASPYGNIPGGSNYNSGSVFGSEGYVDRSASSSGTVSRGCSNSYFYSVQSCGNQGSKNFNFRIYADWNQDGDFDDANEIAAQVSNTIISGNCAFYNSTVSISVPMTANTGTIRMRWALTENGTATSCGGYIGEIEDYSITVSPNNAPVLDNSGTPVLNPLAETQTNNNGMLISRFIKTTGPAVTLISEPDACAYIKGIAITGTSGTNGTWQFKTSAGSWTDMGSLSESNALLLEETDRIRFVPTGTGTPAITFRAWDRTTGGSGQFYNITSTGGTTAFSSASESASLEVYSAASTASDVSVYLSAYGGSQLNILSSSLSPSSGTFKDVKAITSDDVSGYGSDILLNPANTKLYWLGGSTYADLLRSNVDGTGVESLNSGDFSYPTGLATGGNKLFIADYGVAIYSADMDGTNLTAITGGAGQATDIGDLADIEYYAGKIYYFNQPGYSGGFKIFEANPDGTGTTELLTIDYYPYGLDVINGNLYWTESDGSDSYLRTRAISGGSVTTLATGTGRYFLDLMVNPSLNKIYFTDEGNSDPYIKSIPLAGGSATNELVLENSMFGIVFNRSLGTLPVHFTNVKAWPQGNKNIIEWNIASEKDVSHYVIERSADGSNFSAAGTVSATQHSSYQWSDLLPLTGKNYYRILSVDIDGKQLYSPVVLVNREEQNKNVTIFPTTINNSGFILRTQNIAPGAYQLLIINNTGQQVFKQSIMNNGGNSAEAIRVPSSLSTGLYRVVLSGNNEIYTNSIMVR